MNTKALLVGVLATAALAAGCVTPSPAQLQAAEEARTQVEPILNSFAEALRQRDTDALKPLLSPYLAAGDEKLLEMNLLNGASLAFYSNYRPDFAAALANTDWQEWQKDLVVVQVPYTDPYGTATVDKFILHHRDNRWHLVGFELKPVQPGDLLNPPEDVQKLLRDKGGQLLQELRAGNYMTIYYELPKESTIRRIQRTWWEKATTDKPESVSVLDDLERMQEFTIMDWPKPEEASFVFTSDGGVAVHYDLPYVWPKAGLSQPDVLRLEFVFLPVTDGWVFHRIRMTAIGIPWSR
jgi:hypothetical protein